MSPKWFAMVVLTGFAGAAQAAPGRTCDEMVSRFDAYLKTHPNATADLRQSVDAQLMHQPTRESLELARKEGRQHLLDLLAKAKAEQRAHDESGCRATLSEVRWMMKP